MESDPNGTAQSVLLRRLGLHHLISTEWKVKPRVNKQMGTMMLVLEKVPAVAFQEIRRRLVTGSHWDFQPGFLEGSSLELD